MYRVTEYSPEILSEEALDQIFWVILRVEDGDTTYYPQQGKELTHPFPKDAANQDFQVGAYFEPSESGVPPSTTNWAGIPSNQPTPAYVETFVLGAKGYHFYLDVTNTMGRRASGLEVEVEYLSGGQMGSVVGEDRVTLSGKRPATLEPPMKGTKYRLRFKDAWLYDPGNLKLIEKQELVGDYPSSNAETVGEKVFHLKEGDIVLREGVGRESEFIQKLTGSPWSHAGIIGRNGDDKLVVVDIYPREGSDVESLPIEKFFKPKSAKQGLILRYKGDASVAEGAAQKARKTISEEGMRYDIFDEYTENIGRQYCSEFVYQTYRKGLSVNLVPKPMDLKEPKNRREKTLDLMVEYADIRSDWAKVASDDTLRERATKVLKGHSGHFIAPSQLESSPLTEQVVGFSTPIVAKES